MHLKTADVAKALNVEEKKRAALDKKRTGFLPSAFPGNSRSTG
ncbi:hypothetical protein OR1_04089 [Geobacter sp. OR-1]|nr:hypothetical protein [Geobacter sp. OR-1]GAM11771.1 hypothetical protein OR1_04089 [Geobacter sp. OR-1]